MAKKGKGGSSYPRVAQGRPSCPRKGSRRVPIHSYNADRVCNPNNWESGCNRIKGKGYRVHVGVVGHCRSR